ncbi:monocarboxylate transporter 9-like isoform X2 [Athalia rosae]|nr:monocarboxylate transporter 9-like isoform X2 [Athalia rosae]XP_048511167.1 monocarboxylate transporter 9-like isoform X2 [Athalia rosae]
MPDAPDGGWGWVVVAAVTISNLALLPIQQCFGLVFEEQFSKLGITATEISVIVHLNATVMNSLGLINGPLLKKFSFRIVASLGTTFIFCGIFLAAFSNSLETIAVAYCIFIAIGQGMMYPAIGLALNTYFSKKRSVAMGLTITMTGLGPIVMPQLIAKLLESYATTGTLLILAGIALHSYIGACLLWPLITRKILDVERNRIPGEPEVQNADNEANDKIPEEAELITQPDRRSRVEATENENSRKLTPHVLAVEDEIFLGPLKQEDLKEEKRSIFSKIADSLDLDLLRNNHFLVIILGMGITLVSELNFSLMMPIVLAELAELVPGDIATVMSVQASADITGRLCVPLVAQKFGWSSKNLYAVSLLGSITGRTILAFWSSSYAGIIAISLLLGVAKGTKAVFQALVVPDNVPLVKLPAASGLLMVCNGVLSMALGPLIGLVHDKTHSYVMALHFTSILSLSCIVLWIIEYFCCSGRAADKKNVTNEETPAGD